MNSHAAASEQQVQGAEGPVAPLEEWEQPVPAEGPVALLEESEQAILAQEPVALFQAAVLEAPRA